MDGLPAGKELLPVPGVGANMEQRRTWSVMPLPHHYASPILEQYVASMLTCRWLYDNMAVPIRGDPAQAAAYIELLNCLNVSSTRQAGVGGGANWDPQTEMNHVRVIMTPQLQELAMTVAQTFCQDKGSQLASEHKTITWIISNSHSDKH